MEINSNISIYDFLTMVVSGFLILAFFQIPCFSDCPCSPLILLLFILVYLVGMFWHRLVELMRNSVMWKRFVGSLGFFFVTIGTRNSIAAIRKTKEAVSSQLRKEDIINNPIGSNDAKELAEYYIAYENMAKSSSWGAVRQLEAQEAFMRDVTFLLLVHGVLVLFGIGGLFSLLTYCVSFSPKILGWILIGVSALLLFMRYVVQMKIYSCVWSSDLITRKQREALNRGIGRNECENSDMVRWITSSEKHQLWSIRISDQIMPKSKVNLSDGLYFPSENSDKAESICEEIRAAIFDILQRNKDCFVDEVDINKLFHKNNS